mmetsp:Transcript_15801/g.44214  ORF Transcript_15801/g.44214 Transcript_15801/m.44214 type:complete len:165 (-) Transcript_15801:2662-3156(-)
MQSPTTGSNLVALSLETRPPPVETSFLLTKDTQITAHEWLSVAYTWMGGTWHDPHPHTHSSLGNPPSRCISRLSRTSAFSEVLPSLGVGQGGPVPVAAWFLECGAGGRQELRDELCPLEDRGGCLQGVKPDGPQAGFPQGGFSVPVVGLSCQLRAEAARRNHCQ